MYIYLHYDAILTSSYYVHISTLWCYTYKLILRTYIYLHYDAILTSSYYVRTMYIYLHYDAVLT